jgi:hypothetical protein
MCNGGCKCGCAGTCNSTICGSTGGCCGACNACPPSPPPSCGCGELILAGETCLNTSYFLVGPNLNNTNPYDGSNPTEYWQFNFGYCLMTPPTQGSFNENMYQIIAWYYDLEWLYISSPYNIPSGYYLTSISAPTGISSATGNYGSAKNSFVWPNNVAPENNANPFSSYLISECNSSYPITQYNYN